jgi:hypothetical protein
MALIDDATHTFSSRAWRDQAGCWTMIDQVMVKWS